jgi:hypothetical protein
MDSYYDHEYPPADWSVDELAETLAEADREFPLPTFEDRSRWETIASTEPTADIVADVVETAREKRGERYPRHGATAYLKAHREGEGSGGYSHERRSLLGQRVVAECVEADGEYLDDIYDAVWTICERTSWVGPFHLHQHPPSNADGLPGLPDDENRHIDLHVANISQSLGELDYILGDELHDAVRDRIRHEADRKAFTPYLGRDDFWWNDPPVNNWSPACNAGVAIAALHLEDDPRRQAEVVMKAVRSLEHYLEAFDDDGATAEGVSYWGGGFSSYTALAAHLEARTDGEFSLFSPPIVEEIARFPINVQLSPTKYPSFSDMGGETSTLVPHACCWLGKRLDIPGLGAMGRRDVERDESRKLHELVRNLAWPHEVPADWELPEPPLRKFFDGTDWWVSRTHDRKLAVATKGGHNAESHNHNDLGSFVVHLDGESPLRDLGSQGYTHGYFGDERYEFLAARSLGHSVPYVNGHEQASVGELHGDPEYSATVLDRTEADDRDDITYELADAYPDEAGLASLRRTFELVRPDRQVVVTDRAQFAADAPGEEFVSMLVSYFPMNASGDVLIINGETTTTTVDVEGAETVDVERLPEAIRDRDVWRARITLGADGPDLVRPATETDDLAAQLTIEPRLD